ncbi:hypothetical protein ACE1TF_09065 [Geomicrobium sp. JSM 1781026]|uniref:hypothetical protein n=1 Tax=Geomicrobium sp. JSM 1781026 TaxID=3344580 RepID=UPI0035C0E302
MKPMTGPLLLMRKEMNFTFVINMIITVVLFFSFAWIGSIEADASFVLFGPIYAVFLLYPWVNFKGYSLILSLGGTRRQFVISFYLIAIVFMILSVAILHGLYLINDQLLQWTTFTQTGELLGSSHPLLYIWADFIWLFALFSISLFIRSFLFNFGSIMTLSLGAVLLILFTSWFFLGDMSAVFEFILTNHLAFLHIMLGISLLLSLVTYLLMRNGPLENGGRIAWRSS